MSSPNKNNATGSPMVSITLDLVTSNGTNYYSNLTASDDSSSYESGPPLTLDPSVGQYRGSDQHPSELDMAAAGTLTNGRQLSTKGLRHFVQ